VLAWKMFAGSGVRLVGPTLFTSRRTAASPGGEA
jgi:hypothetical protein